MYQQIKAEDLKPGMVIAGMKGRSVVTNVEVTWEETETDDPGVYVETDAYWAMDKERNIPLGLPVIVHGWDEPEVEESWCEYCKRPAEFCACP